MQDPFATPPEKRSPARRLRGRLPAPVTIWTSGNGDTRTGLTVSSILVAEGDPSFVVGLINDMTDLWDSMREAGRFAVHLLAEGDRVLAERFAGTRPTPGGPFVGVDYEDSPHGPLLAGAPNRVLCSLEDIAEGGYQKLVRGRIDSYMLDGLEDPLVYFRGGYRRLLPRPDRG